MHKSILLSIVVLLFAIGIYLIARLSALPDVPPELLLEEESLTSTINNYQHANLVASASHMEDLFNYLRGDSYHREKEAFKNTIDLYKKSNTNFSRAFTYNQQPDSLENQLNALAQNLEQLNSYRKSLTGDALELKIPVHDVMDVPGELRSLKLATLQQDVNAAYSIAFRDFYPSVSFGAIPQSPGSLKINGQIAFNPPSIMHLHQRERIQVRISQRYLDNLVSTMNRTGNVQTDSIPVRDIMLVKLIGENFKIVAFDDETQAVSPDEYTQWEFEITPLQAGTQNLYLKVGALYNIPNLGNAPKYLPVYEKIVKVEVNTWEQIADFATTKWEFLLTTLIIPPGVWGFNWLLKRRDQKNSNNDRRRKTRPQKPRSL